MINIYRAVGILAVYRKEDKEMHVVYWIIKRKPCFLFMKYIYDYGFLEYLILIVTV